MSWSEAPFDQRVERLPWLGLGISTEFGARQGGLDLASLRSARPEWVRFLEVGADLERGVDEDARAWSKQGLPTTYHFLDVNLEDPEDLDESWMQETGDLARSIGAAWLCGDAGLWHVGPRERGHGVLMPPVLEPSSADVLADNVRRLRHASGMEVLPENPPAHVFLGRLHLIDYFARVAERADSGLLLDVAHLAVFQRVRGHDPFEAFERLPFERIVEMHVAGGTPFEREGANFVDDDHGCELLPETWGLFEAVLERAPHLKAIVFECERNRIDQVLPVFERLNDAVEATRAVREPKVSPSRCESSFATPHAPDTGTSGSQLPLGRLQRTLFRLQADEPLARAVFEGRPEALGRIDLPPPALALLLEADLRGLCADPGRRRRWMVLGNLLTEYRLSHARALEEGQAPDFAQAFLSSKEFHCTMDAGEPLPFACGAWLERFAREQNSPALSALVQLEVEMVRARRGPLEGSEQDLSLAAGDLVRSPRARCLSLPNGTHDLAETLRLQLDSPQEATGDPLATVEADAKETLMIVAAPRSSPHRVAELEVERLTPPTDRLLLALERPKDRRARAQLARELGAEPQELERFAAELVREGVLLAGAAESVGSQRRS